VRLAKTTRRWVATGQEYRWYIEARRNRGHFTRRRFLIGHVGETESQQEESWAENYDFKVRKRMHAHRQIWAVETTRRVEDKGEANLIGGRIVVQTPSALKGRVKGRDKGTRGQCGR